MVVANVDGSRKQADSRPKLVGLVRGLAAVWP